MKLAFSGASHWHLPLYLEPALEVQGASIVAVSDPDPVRARDIAQQVGCAGFRSLEHMVAKARPDFVFVLGRHADMAAEARFLISQKIPFAIEKPCGIDLREVRELAGLSAAAQSFAAVPLVFRNGDLWKLLEDGKGGGGYQYAAFRFIAGFASRYREAGCDWMLDPAQSGGGCTINLSVHFFDMCRMLLGDVSVLQASMSNAGWGLPIEDYSAVTLKGEGGSLCLTETGYLFPAPTSRFDMHFAIRSPELYVVALDAGTVEIVRRDGARERRKMPTTNVPNYRRFVVDVLDRVERGEPPLAGLADMVPVMALVEAAYAQAEPMTPRRSAP